MMTARSAEPERDIYLRCPGSTICVCVTTATSLRSGSPSFMPGLSVPQVIAAVHEDAMARFANIIQPGSPKPPPKQ